MRTNDKFILIEFAFIDTSCIYGKYPIPLSVTILITIQYRASYFILAFIAPNNVSQTSCFEEWKNVVGGDVSSRLERYGQSVIDRENAISSRWKETGSRGKSVGDVKLGNHATYQGPYLQLVQDDSLLNISETLTFP